MRTCFLVHRWPSCFVLSWQKRSLAVIIHVHDCRGWAQRTVFCHIHRQLPSFFYWSFASFLYKYLTDLFGHLCSNCYTTGQLGSLHLVLISLRYVSALYFLLGAFLQNTSLWSPVHPLESYSCISLHLSIFLFPSLFCKFIWQRPCLFLSQKSFISLPKLQLTHHVRS